MSHVLRQWQGPGMPMASGEVWFSQRPQPASGPARNASRPIRSPRSKDDVPYPLSLVFRNPVNARYFSEGNGADPDRGGRKRRGPDERYAAKWGWSAIDR